MHVYIVSLHYYKTGLLHKVFHTIRNPANCPAYVFNTLKPSGHCYTPPGCTIKNFIFCHKVYVRGVAIK